jgi:acetyltransferase-like isoleucine patch superfamily enzyme
MVTESQFLRALRSKLARHRGEPLAVLVHRAVSSTIGLATAPLHLRAVTQVGARVRTLGRPRIENFGTMIIGDDVTLRSVRVPVELCTEPGATLTIGDRCSINEGVSVGTTQHITLGRRVRIGPFVMIVDSAFHDLYDRDVTPPSRPVFIEDDVWIGAKASVLPGVRLGRGSVVGTAAVVTRDVPPFSVVAGIPARVIRSLDPNRFRVASP